MQYDVYSVTKSFSFWGTSFPRPPTGALPLDPAGALRPQNSSFLLAKNGERFISDVAWQNIPEQL